MAHFKPMYCINISHEWLWDGYSALYLLFMLSPFNYNRENWILQTLHEHFSHSDFGSIFLLGHNLLQYTTDFFMKFGFSYTSQIIFSLLLDLASKFIKCSIIVRCPVEDKGSTVSILKYPYIVNTPAQLKYSRKECFSPLAA